MKIVTSPPELRHHLASFAKERIALVPTMGALHEGHVSLIQKAKKLADIVVVSVFVNPLQFSPNEDLSTYPKPFEKDVEICTTEGVDFLFHPQNIYPDAGLQVGLHVNDLSQQLCGASRVGHFDGVVTAVNILFNIVQPHISIFGEKDFQQLTIIRRMVSDFFIPIEIVGAETVREKNGLAKSSRNQYLNNLERKQAAEIPAALKMIQSLALENANTNALIQVGLNHLTLHHIHVEYLDIRDEVALGSTNALEENISYRVFVAARIGNTRLIDNMPLQIKKEEPPCV